MYTKKAWSLLRNGGHITTEELRAMKEELESALPFLTNHSQMGAARRAALMDLGSIHDYLRARGKTT